MNQNPVIITEYEYRKLKLPESAIEFLKSQGFEKLYPPQADSVKSGLLDGKSILVSAPTASGKTLIAILAMISYLSQNNGKVIYLSPLRALAAEKFSEFKKLEKVALGKKSKWEYLLVILKILKKI